MSGFVHISVAVREFLTELTDRSANHTGAFANDVPPRWIDFGGRSWKTPKILGRLKPGKSLGHSALRAFVLERDGYRCQRCRKQFPVGESIMEDSTGRIVRLIADHIISRRNGGAHYPTNMQALCEPCNARKAVLVDAKGPPVRQPDKGGV